MQMLVISLIVAVAVAFLIRNFLKKFKGQDQCGCDCSSCPMDAGPCEEKPPNLKEK
jgi:hypothetical protein